MYVSSTLAIIQTSSCTAFVILLFSLTTEYDGMDMRSILNIVRRQVGGDIQRH